MGDHLRLQVTIPRNVNPGPDSVVNTYSYQVNDGFSVTQAITNITIGIAQFYSQFVTNLSSEYAWQAMNVVTYRLEDPAPRVPIDERAIGTVNPPNTSLFNLPSEVAVVLSFRAALASGQNKKRTRGRIYLGPFAFATGDIPLVPAAYPPLVVGAAETYLFRPTGTQHCVYSPYTHHGVPVGGNIADFPDEEPDFLPASYSPVAEYWCDNAWDVQRRRGIEASTRAVSLAAQNAARR